MYKVNITSLLPPETKRKFINTALSKDLVKGVLFIELLDRFKKKLSASINYIPKHQNIDRIYDINTTVIVFEETLVELDEIAKKLDLSRRAAVREIICEYFSTNK